MFVWGLGDFSPTYSMKVYFQKLFTILGKAKSNAKTELEKLKMADLPCAQLIKEAARIIYMVHDEVKDKMFELELSWVGEFTNGVHQKVPKDVSTILVTLGGGGGVLKEMHF